MDSNSPARFSLRPAKTTLKKAETNGNSQENSHNSNGSNPFSLTNNPFLKCDKDEQAAKESSSTSKDPVEVTNALFGSAKPSNLFTNATTLAENSNFVFGQNLHERVVIDKNENTPPPANKNDGLLFSSVVGSQSSTETENNSQEKSQEKPKDESNETTDKNSPSSSSNNGSSQLSLVEAARKYEEMKGAQKRKYEEVSTVTGEEDEENVLEINCRLFYFKNSNWEDRGRGMLRLNDTKTSSRVVFRLSGIHRVLLNTKVWRNQYCSKLNNKAMRFSATAADSGQAHIYLVQGRPEDIESLYNELQRRIEREQLKTPEEEDEEEEKKENSPEPEEIAPTQPTTTRIIITEEPPTKKSAGVSDDE